MHIEYKYRVVYPIKFRFSTTYFSKSEIFEKVKQYITSTYPNLTDICNADLVYIQNYCCIPTMEINTEFEELPALMSKSYYNHLDTYLRREYYIVYVDSAVSCEISPLHADSETLSQEEQLKIFKTLFSPYFADAKLTEFDFYPYTVLVR